MAWLPFLWVYNRKVGHSNQLASVKSFLILLSVIGQLIKYMREVQLTIFNGTSMLEKVVQQSTL